MLPGALRWALWVLPWSVSGALGWARSALGRPLGSLDGVLGLAGGPLVGPGVSRRGCEKSVVLNLFKTTYLFRPSEGLLVLPEVLRMALGRSVGLSLVFCSISSLVVCVLCDVQ